MIDQLVLVTLIRWPGHCARRTGRVTRQQLESTLRLLPLRMCDSDFKFVVDSLPFTNDGRWWHARVHICMFDVLHPHAYANYKFIRET